jgi:hypothetical protein
MFLIIDNIPGFFALKEEISDDFKFQNNDEWLKHGSWIFALDES